MSSKTRGSGTKDIQIQILDLYSHLTWLDQYIQPRDTLHNMDKEKPKSNPYDDIDTYEFDDNASLAPRILATVSSLSSVTGRQKYRKRVR